MNTTSQEYERAFRLYQEAQERLKLLGEQVPRHEVAELEQFYEEKMQQYQEKELLLKDQVETIEQEVNELEGLLEEKENNEEVLVTHTQELQAELQAARKEVAWYSSILDR
jgi:predicted  nucleic acid-binding Zn-ribbon protein